MTPRDLPRIDGPFAADGMRLGPSHLPSSQSIRWVTRRKAEVLAAIRCGLLTAEDAAARYAISMDELISWETAMTRFGPQGLFATRHPHR
jgi:hypothetical protein